MPNTFHASILTPDRTFWEAPLTQIVLQVTDGELAVLAGHQPMVVTLIEGTMRMTLPGGEQKLAAASSGFATITPDTVYVTLETCEWPEEIDVMRAERARLLAEEILRQKKSMQEYAIAHSMLARAMVRLRVSDRKHR